VAEVAERSGLLAVAEVAHSMAVVEKIRAIRLSGALGGELLGTRALAPRMAPTLNCGET
jgi:hypothetical protein